MSSRAHIIVVGNAKGGSGKSTTAMHIAMRLLYTGNRVAVLDLDGRQQTLARYLQNRRAHAHRRKIELPMPSFAVVHESQDLDGRAAQKGTHAHLCAALAPYANSCDYILMDCPGSDSYLARLAHGFADTLVTPVNDSFIDLDLLAQVEPETHAVLGPSWYSEMVWAQRKQRHQSDGHAMDWVVLRNRTAHTETRNRRAVLKVLTMLAPRIGFRLTPGLGDRVIFRELFLRGLTLSDLRQANLGISLTMNHVAGHQEVKALVASLRPQRDRGRQAAS